MTVADQSIGTQDGTHTPYTSIFYLGPSKHRQCVISFFGSRLAATTDPLYYERGFDKQPKDDH